MMHIRMAILADIEQIVEIENICFLDAWSRRIWEESLLSSYDTTLLLEEEMYICGYINFRMLFDEGELFRIAIRPTHRKCGYGRELLLHMEEWLRKKNIKQILLEVRESNISAIALYERCGYKKQATRVDYYTKPVEDAWIYRKDIRC